MKVITSESEGVYIMPADSKYTIPELKERMVTVVEEQQYAVLRFLSLVSDFKVGGEKQYIGQVVDLNKIPNLGESMIIAAPTGSGKTKAIIDIIKNVNVPALYLINREDEENLHAFAQKVLEKYDKSTVITDDMFLSYDRITDFKSKVSLAFDDYMNSEKNAEALDKLKSALKDACNSTKIYNDGKIISSNIQLSTVNDILKSAGIEFEIKPKIEIYGVSAV